MKRVLLLLLLSASASAQDAEPPSQLAELLGGDADADFARALEPREFVFPADLGPHKRFRNEWWYFTGNLDGEDGERFGYELTIFRFALAPTEESSLSIWRSNQIYIAHFAVTDAEDEHFYVAQRYSRGGALGLAGATAEPFAVWIDDWRINGTLGNLKISARGDDFGIDLSLVPTKPSPVVLNGIDGLSQKSAESGNASYYYSVTRLQTEGALGVDGREYRVTGLSWFDREWSTSALADNQIGWDWFALQLPDGNDLMFYNLRFTDGSQDPASAGTWVDADGIAKRLDADDLIIQVAATWDSPAGGSYPSRWHLSLPSEDLRVTVTPVITDQELFTTVRYWEGAVDVVGHRGGKPISGRGYVELTGYAR